MRVFLLLSIVVPTALAADSSGTIQCKIEKDKTISLTAANMSILNKVTNFEYAGECINALAPDMTKDLTGNFFRNMILCTKRKLPITNANVVLRFLEVVSKPTKDGDLNYAEQYSKFLEEIVRNTVLLKEVLDKLARPEPRDQQRAEPLFTPETMPIIEDTTLGFVHSNLLAHVSGDAIAAINNNQIRNFKPEAFSKLTADRLARLQPGTFAYMTVEQAAMIPVAAYAGFTLEQAHEFPAEPANSDKLTEGLAEKREQALLKHQGVDLSTESKTATATFPRSLLTRTQKASSKAVNSEAGNADTLNTAPAQAEPQSMLEPYAEILKLEPSLSTHCFLALTFAGSLQPSVKDAVRSKCQNFFRNSASAIFQGSLVAIMATLLLLSFITL